MELQRRYGDLKVSQLDFESGGADSNPIRIMVLSSWAYHFENLSQSRRLSATEYAHKAITWLLDS